MASAAGAVVGQKKTCNTCLHSKYMGKHGKDTNFKWIECDGCVSWYHGNCQGLDAGQVAIITDLDDK